MRQRLSGTNRLAEVHRNANDPRGDARRDVRDAILIGADGGGQHELCRNGLRLQRLDCELRQLSFARRQLEAAFFLAVLLAFALALSSFSFRRFRLCRGGAFVLAASR